MRRLATTVLAGVLLESGEPVSGIRLMKLLFLLRQETLVPAAGAFYDFLPYKYGPYSFAAHRDLREMLRNGLVAGERFRVTEWGQAEAQGAYGALPASVRAQVREVVERYRTWPDEHLIADVYARYPAYTVLSQRHDRVPPRRRAAPAVYTLGYEGSSVDLFLHTAITCHLARIVDVRNNPISRRYGYSKDTLAGLCGKVGMDYMHIPALGIPSRERQGLSDAASVQRLLAAYEEMLAGRPTELRRASMLVREKASALLCFEADPARCHRGRLATRLAELTGLPVHHLEVSRA